MKLSERSQVTVGKPKKEGDEPWQTSLPRTTHAQGMLKMPPGENASGPEDFKSGTPLVAAGSTDVTDTTTAAAVKGYVRLPMNSSDDQESGEHTDHFYETPVVDGESGAVERNNYLDRS